MPELPEVETIRRRLAPLVEGRTLRALEILDARWCEPLDPSALAGALEGRRVRRLGRRGKYLIWEADDEVFLLMHLRMTGTLLYDAPPDAPLRARALRALRLARRELLRPAPLRDRPARARRAGARGVPRRSPGRRAARCRLHDRAPVPADAQEARADQGGPARPAPGRGRRQHLRQRGAVPCPGAPAARGAPAQARPGRGAARRRRRPRWRPASTPAAPRSTTSAIPTASRARFRTSSSCTAARRAVPGLRRRDREVRRRRARDLRVRVLPATPAPGPARRGSDESCGARPRAAPAGGRSRRPRRSRDSRRRGRRR